MFSYKEYLSPNVFLWLRVCRVSQEQTSKTQPKLLLRPLLANGSHNVVFPLSPHAKSYHAAVVNCSAVLKGHADDTNALAYTPDVGTLVSGSADATVRLWRLSDNTCTAILKGHTSTVCTLAPTTLRLPQEVTTTPSASGTSSTAPVRRVTHIVTPCIHCCFFCLPELLLFVPNFIVLAFLTGTCHSYITLILLALCCIVYVGLST